MAPLGMVAAAALLIGCQPIGTSAASTDDPMDLGVRLMREGQHSQALSAFNRALADDVNAAALTGMASAYHALGQRRQAEELLRAAVKRDANFALARNNLGIMHYEDGDYAAAERELRRAYAITGGADATIARNLAFAEFAISQIPSPVAEDADAFDVIQYGHGLYRLERAEKDPS